MYFAKAQRPFRISMIMAVACGALAARAADVGTAFTYQGFLERPAGTAVTGTCTFEFVLCDDALAACAPGAVSTHPGVAVIGGLFAVPDVNFGGGMFAGEARWMEINVRCLAGC